MLNTYFDTAKTYLTYLSKDPITLYTAFGLPALVIILYLAAVFIRTKKLNNKGV